MGTAARWEFRPGLAATLLTLCAVPLLAALGFWQLDRAAQKDALHAAFLERSTGTPIDLNAPGTDRTSAEDMQFHRVRLHGQFLTGTVFLLDNQVHAYAAGYDVYTPMQLAGDDVVVLVNRGWIPVGPDRSKVQEIDTPREVIEFTGVARSPSAPPLMIEDAPLEQLVPGVFRVQKIDVAAIAALHHWKLLPYEIRLDAGAPAGFVRDWPMPGSGRERHIGYAVQWFAMAAVAAILYVYFNLRRRAAS